MQDLEKPKVYEDESRKNIVELMNDILLMADKRGILSRMIQQLENRLGLLTEDLSPELIRMKDKVNQKIAILNQILNHDLYLKPKTDKERRVIREKTGKPYINDEYSEKGIRLTALTLAQSHLLNMHLIEKYNLLTEQESRMINIIDKFRLITDTALQKYGEKLTSIKLDTANAIELNNWDEDSEETYIHVTIALPFGVQKAVEFDPKHIIFMPIVPWKFQLGYEDDEKDIFISVDFDCSSDIMMASYEDPTSGDMEGEKIDIAERGLDFVIERLSA